MARTLYTLEVLIVSGPMSEEFGKANPSVVRTLEIRGDQTLQQLHGAVFRAFDRREEHLYEFRFGDGPRHRRRGRYGPRSPFENADLHHDFEPAGDTAKTTLDSLGLEVDQSFGYWFDFGDDWLHQISILAIGRAESRVKYPRVTARVGDSPPQYMDWDAEEGDDEDE